jgi:hypothetical protein
MAQEPARGVNDNKLQKRMPATIVEKGQYALAIVVVGAMLVVAGFPAFVVFFFGIFAYFLWKIFSSGSRSETREIFEFYLAANEILRDDERRWYGFEIREIIDRGNRIVRTMSGAPPLIYFALGALHHKIGDHKDAATNLASALENEQSDELNFVFPSPELRNYVRVLRKIEREPAEAPMTSSAVRSLERARRIRGNSLLEESRRRMQEMEDAAKLKLLTEETVDAVPAIYNNGHSSESVVERVKAEDAKSEPAPEHSKRRRKDKSAETRFSDRKPISEVLHDIYDSNTH